MLLLTCPGCAKIDLTGRTLLPCCGESVCQSCCKRCSSKTGAFTCPVCRQPDQAVPTKENVALSHMVRDVDVVVAALASGLFGPPLRIGMTCITCPTHSANVPEQLATVLYESYVVTLCQIYFKYPAHRASIHLTVVNSARVLLDRVAAGGVFGRAFESLLLLLVGAGKSEAVASEKNVVANLVQNGSLSVIRAIFMGDDMKGRLAKDLDAAQQARVADEIAECASSSPTPNAWHRMSAWFYLRELPGQRRKLADAFVRGTAFFMESGSAERAARATEKVCQTLVFMADHGERAEIVGMIAEGLLRPLVGALRDGVKFALGAVRVMVLSNPAAIVEAGAVGAGLFEALSAIDRAGSIDAIHVARALAREDVACGEAARRCFASFDEAPKPPPEPEPEPSSNRIKRARLS
ncbi:MAG: hypothetical protein B7Z66_14525 [Chromatiales bacterium 21-64-14]|nr:MAG: hypothetical protein B7Z66_14525 [Chromatiales bacterium 21-64-14]